MHKPITIRHLESYDDFLQCVEIQKQTWGPNDVIPATMQKANSHIGGINLGAFNNEGKLVGSAYGATGPFKGEIVHWSHMLVVDPEWREKGLGLELKIQQRENCLNAGVTKMLWTYDPLEARNGYINFNKLGVKVHDYVEDHYGLGENNILLQGLGTDRFIVEWDLLADQPNFESKKTDLIPVTIQGPYGSPPFVDPKNKLGIELPSAIQELKKIDSDLAKAWRSFTRNYIQAYRSKGFDVSYIHRDDDGNFIMVLEK